MDTQSAHRENSKLDAVAQYTMVQCGAGIVRVQLVTRGQHLYVRSMQEDKLGGSLLPVYFGKVTFIVLSCAMRTFSKAHHPNEEPI